MPIAPAVRLVLRLLRHPWSADFYGYAPIESKGMRSDYKRIREYEARAERLRYEVEDYAVRRQKTRELLEEMLNELRIEEEEK